MLILSGYGEEIQQKVIIPKSITSEVKDKLPESKDKSIFTPLNVTVAGVSVVGIGLALLVIGFPAIKNVVTTVAAGMTGYKLIQQLEQA